MPRVTVSISDEQEEYLREKIESSTDLNSKSGAIRECINDDDRVHQLEETISRLENEKRMILEQREEHTDLVESIQRDQTLTEKKSHAHILTRWKWKITGIPKDE